MPSRPLQLPVCNIRYTENPSESNCATHGGPSHADDIFCDVFFGKYLDEAVIYRHNQNLPEEILRNPNAYIYDIGHGELDHHQKGRNGFHPNKKSFLKPVPYAAFGLVWKKFGRDFCHKLAENYGNLKLASFLWNWVENQLVLGIDASDNGTYPKTPAYYEPYRSLTFSNVLTYFAPLPIEPQNYIHSYKRASQLASVAFDTVIKKGIWQFEHPHATKSAPFYATKFQAHNIFAHVILKRIFPHLSQKDIEDFPLKKDILYSYHDSRYPNQNEKFRIPTSTLGVMWKKYGEDFCKTINPNPEWTQYLWNFINEKLVIPIDAFANGIKPVSHWKYVPYPIFTLSDFLLGLSPMNCSPTKYTEAYQEALYWADSIFERILKKGIDSFTNKPYVDKMIEESSNHILTMDRFVHWKEWVLTSKNPKAQDLWFVVFPSLDGNYNISTIPEKAGCYRKNFPHSWLGLRDEELQKESKVPGANFVHNEGFLAGACDLNSAKLLIEQACSLSTDVVNGN